MPTSLRHRRPHHLMRLAHTATLAAAVLMIPAASASAQSLSQQTRRLAGTTEGPSHIISVNPFLPLFGYFSGEFEQRIAPNVSIALGASHTKFDDTKRSNLDVKARLYPTERGLQGLGVAASLGIARIDDEAQLYCTSIDNFDPVCESPKAFNTGSFAIEASYQWLLGPSRKTAIAVGGGAKRYFGSESHYSNSSSSIERVIPTLRLSIGYAF